MNKYLLAREHFEYVAPDDRFGIPVPHRTGAGRKAGLERGVKFCRPTKMAEEPLKPASCWAREILCHVSQIVRIRSFSDAPFLFIS
jgi:hypothetical protein